MVINYYNSYHLHQWKKTINLKAAEHNSGIMPKRELTIKYLKNQLNDPPAAPENLHEWLQTSQGYAEQYFGSNHQRIRQMHTLAMSVYGDKLNQKSGAELIAIEQRAIGYINEFIDDLEDLLKQDDMEKSKVKYPLGMNQEVFWTVILAVIGTAFGLGFYFGNNKFDREKIDYYNQIRILESDTAELKDAIHYHEIIGRTGDSILRSLRDSLVKTNTRLQRFDSAARQKLRR